MAVGLVLAAGVAAAQTFDVPQGRWWGASDGGRAARACPDQVKQLDSTTYDFARRMVDLKATVEKAAIDLRAASDASRRAGQGAPGVRRVAAGAQPLGPSASTCCSRSGSC